MLTVTQADALCVGRGVTPEFTGTEKSDDAVVLRGNCDMEISKNSKQKKPVRERKQQWQRQGSD